MAITGSSYSGNDFSKGHHATTGLRMEIADTSLSIYFMAVVYTSLSVFVSVVYTSHYHRF